MCLRVYGAPPKGGEDDDVDVDAYRITVTVDGLRVASLPSSADALDYEVPCTSQPPSPHATRRSGMSALPIHGSHLERATIPPSTVLETGWSPKYSRDVDVYAHEHVHVQIRPLNSKPFKNLVSIPLPDVGLIERRFRTNGCRRSNFKVS